MQRCCTRVQAFYQLDTFSFAPHKLPSGSLGTPGRTDQAGVSVSVPIDHFWSGFFLLTSDCHMHVHTTRLVLIISHSDGYRSSAQQAYMSYSNKVKSKQAGCPIWAQVSVSEHTQLLFKHSSMTHTQCIPIHSTAMQCTMKGSYGAVTILLPCYTSVSAAFFAFNPSWPPPRLKYSE
jgi:hypothetical protein